jgi:hypothetical protein
LLRKLICSCQLYYVNCWVSALYYRIIQERILLLLLLWIFNYYRRQLAILLDKSAVQHRHSGAFWGSNRHVKLRYGKLINILRVQSQHSIRLLLLFSTSLAVRY